MKKKFSNNKLVMSALLLAIAFVLPFFTGQLKQIGNMLCPMHLPIMICGFICGPIWGLLVGMIAPVFRSIVFGMPKMVPSAIGMAFELGTYGLISGLLYKMFPKKRIYIYVTLIIAMIFGRIVWGFVRLSIAGFNSEIFSFKMFWAGAILSAIPGIIIQLIVIPIIVMIYDKKVLGFD